MNGYVQSSCPLCWSCFSSACSIAIRNVQRYSLTELKLNIFFFWRGAGNGFPFFHLRVRLKGFGLEDQDCSNQFYMQVWIAP